MGISKPVCGQCSATKAEVETMVELANGTYLCGECIARINAFAIEARKALGGDQPLAHAPLAGEAQLIRHTPKDIVKFLDDYIVGQESAKKTLAIAVANHYKRIRHKGDVALDKSNVLLLGPTGTGKTLLAQTIARLLNVPFAIADATCLTQAGYVGEDVESLIAKLIQAADGDVEKAQRGIIFVDEIDKLAAAKAGPSITRDVSGEGVQQALLKLIEGTMVNVPQAGNRKHPAAAMTQVDTRNILFICAGAFVPLLEKLNKKDTVRRGMGFVAAAAAASDPKEVTPEHLFEFGMIPEFVGRVPVITMLEPLDLAALERILVEPKNAVVRQMQELFSMDGAELVFEPGALTAIAKLAMELKTGARGARGILEKLLKNALFEVPGSNGATVTVSADLVVHVDYPKALAA